jgi:PqqD family protein of HPr-rel-A system
MTAATFIADTEGLRRVALEGLTLLFHARSGMTHIVAPPAPEILDVLASGPADVPALLARLGELYEFEGRQGEAAVTARLAELEAAGLVRRA